MHLFVEFFQFVFQIDSAKNVADCLRAHLCIKLISKFLLSLTKLIGGQKLLFLKGGVAWIRYDILLVIKNPLQALRRHVKQKTQPARHALEKPNVRNGNG